MHTGVIGAEEPAAGARTGRDTGPGAPVSGSFCSLTCTGRTGSAGLHLPLPRPLFLERLCSPVPHSAFNDNRTMAPESVPLDQITQHTES